MKSRKAVKTKTVPSVYPIATVVGVMVGAILPGSSADDFDDLLYWLSYTQVPTGAMEAPESRRCLRRQHLSKLKEILPELAEVCREVRAYSPAWLAELTLRFGEQIDLDEAIERLEEASLERKTKRFLAQSEMQSTS